MVEKNDVSCKEDIISMGILGTKDIEEAVAYLRMQLDNDVLDVDGHRLNFVDKVAYYIAKLGCEALLEKKPYHILYMIANKYSLIDISKEEDDVEETT